MQAARIDVLAAAAQKIFTAQPVVVRVPAPAKLFGDIHGQLRDLLLLLAHYGFPDHRGGDVETVAYVFNGDWVDRGAHQLDVVALLFALKVAYPARVFLVRGNHEFRSQNESKAMQLPQGDVGFAAHVAHRLGALADKGKATYAAVHAAFEWLPLAAKVADAVLVLHGGIGDGSWGLADLASRVPRPLADEFAAGVPPFVQQCLWSDPADSDVDMARGVHHNAMRDQAGANANMVRFGVDVTCAFCAREGVQLVVRSHQFVREGVKFMHAGRLATLFTARNYIPNERNDGALLLLVPDGQGLLRVRAKRLLHADR
jgi:diadenosine tetraphosphatase ApaH/serine/threonine PP2A family protein phosphatase